MTKSDQLKKIAEILELDVDKRTPEEVHKKLKRLGGVLNNISNTFNVKGIRTVAAFEAVADAFSQLTNDKKDEDSDFETAFYDAEARVSESIEQPEDEFTYELQMSDFDFNSIQTCNFKRVSDAVRVIQDVTSNETFWWHICAGPEYGLCKSLVNRTCTLFGVDDIQDISIGVIMTKTLVDNQFTQYNDLFVWEVESIAQTFRSGAAGFGLPEKFYTNNKDDAFFDKTTPSDKSADEADSSDYGEGEEANIKEPDIRPEEENVEAVQDNTSEDSGIDSVDGGDTPMTEEATIEETTPEETTEAAFEEPFVPEPEPQSIVPEVANPVNDELMKIITNGMDIYKTGLGESSNIRPITNMKSLIESNSDEELIITLFPDFAKAYNGLVNLTGNSGQYEPIPESWEAFVR